MSHEAVFLNKLTVANTGLTAYGKKNIPENVGDPAFKVGIFYGTVRGMKKVKATDGEESYALRGDFACECYRKVGADGKDDPNGDTSVYRSDILYLPGGAHDTLLQPFLDDADQAPIDFGYEVAMIAAKNPQGYSWAGRDAIERQAADPLKAIREAIEAKRQAVLPAPTKEAKEKAAA